MRKWWFLIFVIQLVGCSQEDRSSVNKESLFTSLPSDQTGITFENSLVDQPDLNIIEYLYYYNGGGVGVADLNNDGLEDIVFTSNQNENIVYRNIGDLKFEELQLPYPYDPASKWSTGVSLADINNDGLIDIYISQVGAYKSLSSKNLLYINQGNFKFEEKAEEFGLDFQGFSTQAAFFDYDRDGDLDLYLMNHAVHTPYSYRPKKVTNRRDSLVSDRLYLNLFKEEGKYFFIDQSENARLNSGFQGYGLGLVISDLNGDSWPDIYVGNDFHENDYFYLNNQDGTFSESMFTSFQHTSRFTMGVDVADVDGDNDLDLMSLDMLPADNQILMKSGGEDANKVAEIKLKFGYHPQLARNVLQLNNGNGTFSDVALQTKTHATDWSWSVLINDFDQDMDNDLFISNGIFKRPNDLDYINYISSVNFALYTQSEQDSIENTLIETMPSIKIPNYAFENVDGDLTEVSQKWGLSANTYSNGSAYADLDNDGDLDLVVNNVNQKALLYRNNSDKNFISFQFKASKFSSSSLGVTAILYAGGKSQLRENYVVRGFQSSMSPILHFGLDTLSSVDSVSVFWPSGKHSILQSSDLKVNQMNVFIEEDLDTKETRLPNIPRSNNNEFLYEISELDFRHQEDRFNDYDVESLIPTKLSLEGPAIAVEDLNSDGLKDIYVGGAHGQSSSLFIQTLSGGFKETKIEVFEEDAEFEDVDATFFDADKDGDMDLYVVSGGNYYRQGSPFLSDRLYINTGSDWELSTQRLPATNGSSVVAFDIDNDKDLDLFVGSRSIPGAYGLNPENYIFINDGAGKFQLGEKFKGMVTDAAYDSINRELKVVGSWMPFTSIMMEGDKISIMSHEGTNGFWNAIAFKKSGTQTLLGNQGLNAKLQATAEAPVELFLSDFDNNGQSDPIIYYFNQGKSIPLMSRDDLINQIPSLKKKFTSYRSFAAIEDIEQLISGLENTDFERKAVYHVSHAVMRKGDTAKLDYMSDYLNRFWINDIAVNEGNSEFVAFAAGFYGSNSTIGNFDAGGLIIKRDNDYYNVREFVDKQVNKVRWLDESRLLVAVNNGTLSVLEIK